MGRRLQHDEDGLTLTVDGVEHPPHADARRPSRWRHVVLVGLLVVALVVLIVGLPPSQTKRRVPVGVVTIVLVMDVSGSMNADDVQPNRMVAAQTAARQFVLALPRTALVGVVAFSSTARVLSQPTADRGQVLSAIDSLVGAGGTAMGDAIRTALELVRPGLAAPGGPSVGAREPASIVLISDGADTVSETKPYQAADMAAGLQVPVYTVALGTNQGRALIPDGGGGQRLQEVPPDRLTLQDLALRTSGRSYDAPSAQRLAEVYDDIEGRVTRREERRSANYVPVGIGAGLLLLTAVLSLRWRRRLR